MFLKISTLFIFTLFVVTTTSLVYSSESFSSGITGKDKDDIKSLSLFFQETGIKKMKAEWFAEALVLEHDVASKDRCKALHIQGELHNFLSGIGMSEEDINGIVDSFNKEQVPDSLSAQNQLAAMKNRIKMQRENLKSKFSVRNKDTDLSNQSPISKLQASTSKPISESNHDEVNSQSDTEAGYYDYYYSYEGEYEDDIDDTNDYENSVEESPTEPSGFSKKERGISFPAQPLLDDVNFINQTGIKFHCLPRFESRQKRVFSELNITQILSPPPLNDTTKSDRQTLLEKIAFEQQATAIVSSTAENLAAIQANIALQRDKIRSSSSSGSGVNNEDLAKMAKPVDYSGDVTSKDSEIDYEHETNETSLIEANSKNETDAKKVYFRERRLTEMKARVEAKREREATVPKILLGPDCESMICGSCKVIVEELAKGATRELNNLSMQRVGDVLSSLCASNAISVESADIVTYLCDSKFNNNTLPYRDALLSSFDDVDDWGGILESQALLALQRKACVQAGSCTDKQFHLRLTPESERENQWDERCYVCQMFGDELEERYSLTRYINDARMGDIARRTCDRLGLEPKYDAVCRSISGPDHIDSVVFEAKVFWEKVQNKKTFIKRFADHLCEEISFCERWMDPELLRQRQHQELATEVFF